MCRVRAKMTKPNLTRRGSQATLRKTHCQPSQTPNADGTHMATPAPPPLSPPRPARRPRVSTLPPVILSALLLPRRHRRRRRHHIQRPSVATLPAWTPLCVSLSGGTGGHTIRPGRPNDGQMMDDGNQLNCDAARRVQLATSTILTACLSVRLCLSPLLPFWTSRSPVQPGPVPWSTCWAAPSDCRAGTAARLKQILILVNS